MKKMLTFLGIETSCDETAASIIQEKSDGTGKILSNIVSSQIQEHKEFGGVVPELAARAHAEKIDINIVYEDEEIIVVDKPSGIVVHPGAGNKEGTLVNALLYLYKKNLSSFHFSKLNFFLHN